MAGRNPVHKYIATEFIYITMKFKDGLLYTQFEVDVK